MPVLELDGCDLYYDVTGSGPALVFAHGAGGNHLSWWQQVPHFRERFTCMTFAHRGAVPSSGDPDATRFVADIAALVDHLRLDDVRKSSILYWMISLHRCCELNNPAFIRVRRWGRN